MFAGHFLSEGCKRGPCCLILASGEAGLLTPSTTTLWSLPLSSHHLPSCVFCSQRPFLQMCLGPNTTLLYNNNHHWIKSHPYPVWWHFLIEQYDKDYLKWQSHSKILGEYESGDGGTLYGQPKYDHILSMPPFQRTLKTIFKWNSQEIYWGQVYSSM